MFAIVGERERERVNGVRHDDAWAATNASLSAARMKHIDDRHVTPNGASDQRGNGQRSLWAKGALRSFRPSWVDIAWVVFVGLNLAAMRLLPAYQTVPFLLIWVSLTAIYGFRLWKLQPTIITIAAVTLATGGVIGIQVLKGQEDAEYLAEVPLIAMMFVMMVWHGRRRLAVLEQNVRMLNQQRQFLQDASHELRTPITVALGHAELIERATTDAMIADDARVVSDEMLRLRRLANRLLLLASSEGPDFLDVGPVEVESLLVDALRRWGHTPRAWSLSVSEGLTVEADSDRLAVALDALIENAIDHTEVNGHIVLSAGLEGRNVVLTVADSGSGIPAEDHDRIFDRFARVEPGRSREAGGFGLGLPIVKAVAEAHNGSARVRSTLGEGSAFEILLPASARSGREQARDRPRHARAAASGAAHR
jgi:signal transduction histidine kinase